MQELKRDDVKCFIYGLSNLKIKLTFSVVWISVYPNNKTIGWYLQLYEEKSLFYSEMTDVLKKYITRENVQLSDIFNLLSES